MSFKLHQVSLQTNISSTFHPFSLLLPPTHSRDISVGGGSVPAPGCRPASGCLLLRDLFAAVVRWSGPRRSANYQQPGRYKRLGIISALVCRSVWRAVVLRQDTALDCYPRPLLLLRIPSALLRCCSCAPRHLVSGPAPCARTAPCSAVVTSR